MLAVDTNILVRIITNDSPQQTRLAVQLLKEEKFFITKTVLLETEWVLRALYKENQRKILHAFHQLLGLPNVMTENPIEIAQALEWFSKGLDFGDALHIAGSHLATTFITFDKHFFQQANKFSDIVIKLLK